MPTKVCKHVAEGHKIGYTQFMSKNIQNSPNAIPLTFLAGLDLVCFSHLRWRFVFQRPQHLIGRFAKHCRVFFVEEPIFDDNPHLEITEAEKNIWIVVPHLKNGLSEYEISLEKKEIFKELFSAKNISKFFSWYYTPMFLPSTRHLNPEFVVYDCMDELSAFKFAPPALKLLEQEMFEKADIVFTGGYSIYESKKNSHHNIHPFPSSIDKAHFEKARNIKNDPDDQKSIPHPRFGFYGVLDERFDIDLVAEVAKEKPEWQFVMIGPVVKIDPEHLPKLPNIHYLGGKDYQQLPDYLSGWDVATIPFALNESTKFISPTKTPEYLSAGKPVISTPITDVVNPYQKYNLVHIASDAKQFVNAANKIFAQTDKVEWLQRVDAFLAHQSWDKTWLQMAELIEATRNEEAGVTERKKAKVYAQSKL
jgi:glycosyltransferase involved in cell wall biosynthesis